MEESWTGSSAWRKGEMKALAFVIKVIAISTLALIVWTAFTIPQFLAFIGV